ncbi:hypothetical protein [Mesorhizobium sp. INR15]|uniref:hypothetical protein n=1 Tax=Mesorhizobium sp. INR15 TaxID=2654248 RepID=UPI0018965211|nr:hypothetical protein [Mesorhizobium sp. INR15]QPC93829.1 hypothetical protein GA829_26390 [Mesorhizobium sp. INR15]
MVANQTGLRRLVPNHPDISLETLSEFRQAIAETVSLPEAHRVIKIWRALWNVLAALQYCHGKADPSLGIRNRAPKAAVPAGARAKRSGRPSRLGARVIAASPWPSLLPGTRNSRLSI